MPKRRFITKEELNCKQLLKTSSQAIVNLSNHELSKDDKTVLSRGLSFCPQPTQVNKIDIHRDSLLFNRCLRLKHYFKDSEPRDYDPFGVPTVWTPPVGKSPHLDTYINVTTTEILEHKPLPTKCTNITHREL